MFLTSRADIDDRSVFGDFWFSPVGVHTSTGVTVNPDSAMQLAAVYACVQLLAKCFAMAPFCLYKTRSDGGRDPQKKHWLYKLLAKRPNRYQNPFEWRQMLMGHLALRGNAYNYIVDAPDGSISELIPKHPDRMRTELLQNGDYRYRYRLPDGTEEIIPRGQIWHLRGLSNDGIVGIGPISYQREVIGSGLAAQQYGNRFFQNDATPPGWIEHPAKFKDKTARDEFRESFQRAQTGKNRGKLAVLESGLKYHEIKVSNSDAQYLESRRFSVSEVARIFGVPPHLIGDLDRATFANIEQQSLEFVLYTMAPIAEQWEAAVEYSLLPDQEEDGPELEPEFDLARLLRGDQTSRANFYVKMFGIGAFSTNDVILREGGNPVEGGDRRFVPVNLTPLDPQEAIDQAVALQNATGGGDAEEPPEDEREEGEDAPEPGDNRAEERLAALAQAQAARLTRRELGAVSDALRSGKPLAAAYERHAGLLAEALGVSLATAQGYCVWQQALIEGLLGQHDQSAASITPFFENTFTDITRGRLIGLAQKGQL